MIPARGFTIVRFWMVHHPTNCKFIFSRLLTQNSHLFSQNNLSTQTFRFISYQLKPVWKIKNVQTICRNRAFPTDKGNQYFYLIQEHSIKNILQKIILQRTERFIEDLQINQKRTFYKLNLSFYHYKLRSSIFILQIFIIQMNKYSLCVIALLLAVAATTTMVPAWAINSPVCSAAAYECSTPSGCWTSCSHPQFKKCEDVFITIYNPSFCAYTKDGRYISYTFACQACQNTEVIAVRDGACTCDFIKCSDNQVCQDGQCIDRHPIDPIVPCLYTKCSAGFVCQNGQCIKPHPIDPIDPCSYINCGPDATCQNGNCVQNIKPCTKLCIKGYICRNGQCVPGEVFNPCALIKCAAGYVCKDGGCVKDCLIEPINLCSAIKCKPGFTCRNGFCLRDIVINPCSFLRCLPGDFCLDGQCIDKCATIRCRQGYNCVAGQCIPQPGLCGVVVCAPEYICENDQCVPRVIDACASIRCNSAEGFYCNNGQCIRDFCDAKKIQCTYPRPDEITCPTKYYLVAPTSNFCGITSDGNQIGYPEQCDACKDKSVQYYWSKPCQKVRPCMQAQPICTCDEQCEYGFSCKGGKCVNKCSMVKCYAGSHCFKGACIPDRPYVDPVINNCAAVTCLTGTKCVNGKCISLGNIYYV